jgi:transposase
MKRIYSARRLVATEVLGRIGRWVDGPCVIGIDVAKRELMLMVRGPDGSLAGPCRVVNPQQIPAVVELVRGIESSGRVVKVAMESSGTYGDALRQALGEARIDLHRVEARRSHDYAEVFDGVPSQHDGKDAAVVAELCAIGKSAVWAFDPPDEVSGRMRMLVEWIDGQDRIRRLTSASSVEPWIGRVEALLARHWPEATEVVGLKSGTLMRALAKYGGPAALSADGSAVKTLSRWGGSLLTKARAEQLVESARTTAGVKQNQADLERMRRTAAAAQEASLQVQRSKRELTRLAVDNAVIRKQAKGVGVVTACVLWCRLGDPNGYPAAGAYRKAMGLNLTERSSGQYKGRLHISKRGDRMVRRWLHLAALRLVGRSPQVRQWYRDKRSRDRNRHLCAITAVVRRLAVALHKVGTGDDPFDAARMFAGPAAAQAAAKRNRPVKQDRTMTNNAETTKAAIAAGGV